MANYKIFENGNEINTIVADEAFCSEYCAANGYTYELMPDPEPVVVVSDVEQLRADVDYIAIMTGVEL